jgi:molybdopterin/thiamine biosynthesis adenylyltransferase
MSSERSRPLALAAALVGGDARAIEHLFTQRRVLVRLEPGLASSLVMHEAFLLAVNEILRFCPNVTIAIPSSATAIADTAGEIVHATYGDEFSIVVSSIDDVAPSEFDAVLTIGTEVHEHPAWVTIDATGWCARVATSAVGAISLPPVLVPANIFAALAAACLGVGQVFLAFVGRPLLAESIELSLFDLTIGVPSTLSAGPKLPAFELDALLVGCGGVANGFAYATARAPVSGHLEAVDKESLRPENLGPYICATRERLGMAKAAVIRDVLASVLTVIPRIERFLFFRARITHGQTSVPAIVIAGLDDERVRHDVQRLWAPTTIDLAAEELTAQVIVKAIGDDGVCLLGAYRVDPEAPDELDRLAAALGLPRERVADFESEITDADVAAAPPEKRAALDAARVGGQRVCGRATALDLHEEESIPDFTPAVPFVTAFSGIVGAAQTARAVLGTGEGSLHVQFSFLSYRIRKLRMRCSSSCECQGRRRAVA